MGFSGKQLQSFRVNICGRVVLSDGAFFGLESSVIIKILKITAQGILN